MLMNIAIALPVPWLPYGPYQRRNQADVSSTMCLEMIPRGPT